MESARSATLISRSFLSSCNHQFAFALLSVGNSIEVCGTTDSITRQQIVTYTFAEDIQLYLRQSTFVALLSVVVVLCFYLYSTLILRWIPPVHDSIQC
jgi:hypothetical protein